MWQQLKNIYHLSKAFLTCVAYGFPARGMTVIGVTGTDGKTTTASLLFHILRQDGKNAALISTVGAVIGEKEYGTGFHVTTPDSRLIQSYIKKAKEFGVTHLVLEVTSHALDQHRTFGIPFAVGVITNITHEHLDYHKTYSRYLYAKSKLIQRSLVGVINKDDSSYGQLVHLLQKKKIITFGMKGADVTKDNIKDFKSHLIGEYNAYNILAAAAVAKHLGVPAEVVKAAVGSFRLPKGRTEVVYSDGFTVMIDFAHTPNAFENLLSTLKKSRNKGRLIHVFGAAGQRDGAKRPVMGEIASRYDDVIVLTAEDPRGESVMKISQEIEKGIIRLRDFPEVTMIEDRQKAIEFAVSLAAKDDIVVITGKGHEESMNLGRGEVVWSDHEAVSSALVKRYEK